jgi:GH15 family glucan-1,4-alpha-glucosidase
MALRIEDYALLSDLASCALVGNDGSIDWLTFPRVDSGACFAALLGDADNGRWKLAPSIEIERVERRYRDSSLVLETVFHTAQGSVAVIDCMPPHDDRHDLVRVVEGRSGSVPMEMALTIRFDYGSVVPWVRKTPGGIEAIGGPDALRLATSIPLKGRDLSTVAEFEVREGERVPFSLGWYVSTERSPQPVDALTAIAETEAWWTDWAQACTYDSDYRDEVMRSLTVLKGLTHAATGGLLAAATTSLPEEIGGSRNWDYRYCWLRDATFSLMALQSAGFLSEAEAWRDWLLRAVAGHPGQLQIMYGPAGERRLTEQEIDWLGGYEGSKPVRIGNAAHDQFQLDVYGEVLDALYQGQRDGEPFSANTQSLFRNLVRYVAENWQEPDDGLWEVRGGRRHFTHSKVMAWVAVDRAIASIDEFGDDAEVLASHAWDRAGGHDHLLADGELKRWKQLRSDIKADVLANGVDDNGAFVQSYGSKEYDASLLLVPLVGFLPPDDRRVAATVAAIEENLLEDGLVRRYLTESAGDGVPGSEGVFLMCSFWLADNYALAGRLEDATKLFERLLSLANDVGLLAEEYDPTAKRMLGNFPQAFSHVSLINTAGNLCAARQRADASVETFPGASHRRGTHRAP